MNPAIKTSSELKLIGHSIQMSLKNNRTAELFQGFMPAKRLIETKNDLIYALEEYPIGFHDTFDTEKEFTKWAAVEVKSFDNIPPGMQKLTVPKGLYAVFTYKGLASNAGPFFNQIFSEWIPKSQYSIDTRPHFAVMGALYNHSSPHSEEDIWIPIV